MSKCRTSLLDCLREMKILLESHSTEAEQDKEQIAILEKRLQKIIRAYDKKLAELQKVFLSSFINK